MSIPFHLSLPCIDIESTKDFYIATVEASIGRSNENWVDINFYNHQITFTKCGEFNFDYKNYRFGETTIPSFHFGIISDKKQWNILFDKLKKKDDLYISKTSFLKGKAGAHNSFYIKDPNEYIIEFKCFENSDEVFKAY